jgi:hypothetical protein
MDNALADRPVASNAKLCGLRASGGWDNEDGGFVLLAVQAEPRGIFAKDRCLS